MDGIINISYINDFLYCPKSLYLHIIYDNFDSKVFHDKPQVSGNLAHESIDQNHYSTSQHILQGLSVYSQRLGVKGKIDLYDKQEQSLIERKYQVKKIYKGYIYQLYAQMYCLEEINYPVSKLFIHSLSDNKRYEVALPSKIEKKEFESLIEKMKSFDENMLLNHKCPHCDNNIYSLLNW